ncbi:S-layer homology domain-containing protein [Cytobacillus firmus]|uniref:S-layer homology domain-containing protein n=1 Tax=Cytobacillus firmus TaxID=1399 RepID=UPI001CFE2BA6|nr:S-layer homology domain-containing protein [Cytobacillus firmus]
MTYQPKIRKKFLSAALSVALVAGSFAPAAGFAKSIHFSDVDTGSQFVDALYEGGIIEGRPDGTFDPGGQVTRAEAAKMIVNIIKLDAESAPKTPFKDVKDNVWYTKYINALYAEGLIKGVSSAEFAPNDKLTRAQFAKLVVDAYSLKIDPKASVPFTDLKKGAWYENYVKTLYKNKLINGTTLTTFSPDNNVRRVDFAKLLTETDWAVGDTLEKPARIIEMSRVINKNNTMTFHGKVTGIKTVKITLSNTTKPEQGKIILEAPAVNGEFTLTTDELVPGKYKISFLDDKGKVQLEDSVEIVELVAEVKEVHADIREDNSVVVTGKTVNADAVKVSLDQKAKSEAKLNQDGTYTLAFQPLQPGEHTFSVTAYRKGKASSAVSKTVIIEALPPKIEDIKAVDEDTISVTFDDGSTAEIDLEMVLNHGENEITFSYKDFSYTAIVSYDALTPAIQSAEAAIAALPEKVSIEDKADVEHARALVNKVFSIKEDAEIQGLEKLESAESRMDYLINGRITLNNSSYILKTGETVKLSATITPEQPIEIPVTWTSSNLSVATVANDGTVTAVGEGTAQITVQTEDGKKATSVITVSDKPILQFNTYANVTINNEIKGISTSFFNKYNKTVTVEKVEVFEDTSLRSRFTKTDFESEGIETQIQPNGSFGISISFRLGLWTTSDNYVKYTISEGGEMFEYISKLK